MRDGVRLSHLTLLVKLETILRTCTEEEIYEALDSLDDIEIAFLDLMLHELSGGIWNSGYEMEIQQSWGQAGLQYSPPEEKLTKED